ncbi:MAG: hypothetical protein ACE3L7_16590 [Candidatus Pristimantibacillus sp.]
MNNWILKMISRMGMTVLVIILVLFSLLCVFGIIGIGILAWDELG